MQPARSPQTSARTGAHSSVRAVARSLRRRSALSEESAQRAIGRLGERLNEQDERLDEIADRILKRFDRLEARFGRDFERLDADTQREFGEQRRDIGEMRDRLKMVEDAATIGTAATITATRTSAQSFWRTTPGRVVKWGTTIAAIGAGIAALPVVAKFIERFWAFIRGTS